MAILKCFGYFNSTTKHNQKKTDGFLMAKTRVFWKNTIRRFRLEFRFLTGTVVIVFLRWVFGMDSSFSAFVHGRKPNLKPQMFFLSFSSYVQSHELPTNNFLEFGRQAGQYVHRCNGYAQNTHVSTCACPEMHKQYTCTL